MVKESAKMKDNAFNRLLFGSHKKPKKLSILRGYWINPNGSVSIDLIESSKMPSFKRMVAGLQPLPLKELKRSSHYGDTSK
jgi:hypothetical protein